MKAVLDLLSREESTDNKGQIIRRLELKKEGWLQLDQGEKHRRSVLGEWIGKRSGGHDTQCAASAAERRMRTEPVID